MYDDFLSIFTEGHPVNLQEFYGIKEQVQDIPLRPNIIAKEDKASNAILFMASCPVCEHKPLVKYSTFCPECCQFLEWYSFDRRLSYIVEDTRKALDEYREDKDYG